MPRKLFGTDGIRGKANSYPMTPELALKAGMAAGLHFNRGQHRHQVVIAKDTRLSGYMIEPALTAGFVSVGMDVVLVGPMPTPAVSMLVRSLRADLGVMISASHNPYQDNGIKLFGPDGFKLSDETEVEIESLINSPDLSDNGAPPDKLGRAKRLDDAPGRYIEFVKNTFPKGKRLDGLKVVVDCANGAAYNIAPKVLWELGAEVIPVGVKPDGFNINRDCGSTSTNLLREQVVISGAHLGLALDGDADRVVMCDEKGDLVDGDQILAIISGYWQHLGILRGGAVVATQMSNLGLEKYLESLDLNMIRTKIGDRYVIEAMREGGYNLGGEQSGHIILSDFSCTGDGIVAALQVLAVLIDSKKPFSEVGRVFTPMPQINASVRYQNASPLNKSTVKNAIEEGEKLLNGNGRVLVRNSGTETVVRIMAEGEDEAIVRNIVNSITEAIGSDS